jgi:hypothetical protein
MSNERYQVEPQFGTGLAFSGFNFGVAAPTVRNHYNNSQQFKTIIQLIGINLTIPF